MLALSPNTRNRTRGLRTVVYLLRLCLRTPLVPGSLRRGLSDQRPASPKGNHSLWSTGRRCRGGNPMEKVKGHLWYLSEDPMVPDLVGLAIFSKVSPYILKEADAGEHRLRAANKQGPLSGEPQHKDCVQNS